MFKKIGKCAYCGDPIYDNRETKKEGRKKYHKGCYVILQREEGEEETK